MMKYTHTYLAENFWNGCAGRNDIDIQEGKPLNIEENGEICEESIKYCLYRALKDFTDRTAKRNDAKQTLGATKSWSG